MKKTKLMLGDNIESLKKLPDNSVDSVVTDPPYGLSFMNKKWDYDVPSVEFWSEVYRVLKPGGHVLSFGGTRTYHRMVVNIEDAGFEIRDQIQWIYGSGFPKSHNIGKAVDKLEGNEREVIGENPYNKLRGETKDGIWKKGEVTGFGGKSMIDKGTSPYEGWGTALKPANEPICVARKPLSEKSVAENVLKWGTGGINVDGCRISSPDNDGKIWIRGGNGVNARSGSKSAQEKPQLNGELEIVEPNPEGRFPANIILECICDEVIKGEKGDVKKNNRIRKVDNGDERWTGRKNSVEGIDNYNDKGDIHTDPNCPCRLLDEQSGVLSNQSKSKRKGGFKTEYVGGDNVNKYETLAYSDKGGASRFFYQAKVSKQERNMGLDGFEDKIIEGRDEGQDERNVAYKPRPVSQKNTHPTVKPVSLMSYLCRLVTPEGGIVLDPFMGSGSTGVAAQLEGFRFVGMEMDTDYFKIAEARINSYEKYEKFKK
jgi:site-specific DNA-methyltransferase (adenine-specific)